ncbi:TetR/AcrR family transcriptional regulator [Phenylobacterium sp.]|jgi:AcrR family transcriptional regulator|uniref:TetR/AcrR family transcriptional regulator n=1 Tax=Phenylobacterium sp. TaxID=1871053 RepID=UPI002F415FD4
MSEQSGPVEVRDRILETASDLFYRQGVRAVGVDLIIAAAGVAKTSLYRHFRTKDDLIAAFLTREDEDFWAVWDRVAAAHAGNAAAELEAHLAWIGERVGRPRYRGCPQLNVAAEFPDEGHPARVVARAHKLELRRRLRGIAERLAVADPDGLAAQLSVMVNGAFVSAQVLAGDDAPAVLTRMAHALVSACGSPPPRPSPAP